MARLMLRDGGEENDVPLGKDVPQLHSFPWSFVSLRM